MISRLEKHLRENIVPPFWLYFNKTEGSNSGFQQFHTAVEMLFNHYVQFLNIINRLDILREKTQFKDLIYGEENAVNGFKLIIRATLLSQLPLDHNIIIEEFYETALKMEDTSINDKQCTVCVSEKTRCNCPQRFHDTNRYSFAV